MPCFSLSVHFYTNMRADLYNITCFLFLFSFFHFPIHDFRFQLGTILLKPVLLCFSVLLCFPWLSISDFLAPQAHNIFFSAPFRVSASLR